MSRKSTELSISDKWSLDEQLGAALRELDEAAAYKGKDAFQNEVFALMRFYDITSDMLVEWLKAGIIHNPGKAG